MSSKKRKSEPGCIATIFGYLIFVCIIALIIDLIRTHISERAKHNLMVVAIVIGVIIFISMVCTIYRKLHRKYTLKQLDKMDGHQFEYACADILKANGYKHVKVTRSSVTLALMSLQRKTRSDMRYNARDTITNLTTPLYKKLSADLRTTNVTKVPL